MANGSFEIPVGYDYVNQYNSFVTPSTVHVKNVVLQRYFRRYLFQKAISVFKWTLPKEWDRDYFLYSLYTYGYIGVIDSPEFGVIPQHGELTGYDVFYRPNKLVITNPLIRNHKPYDINTDCTLLKLTPDYGGICDLVNYYADMLALCSESAGVNLLNSHLAEIFPAKNKQQAESYKKLYDKVAGGEPCVVVDPSMFDENGKLTVQPFTQNLAQTYIVPDLLSDMRKIEAMFDTDVGIPSANTDKRERLVTDEVNANNVETATKCELWLESLKDGCRKVNEMFGVSISVDWRVDPVTVSTDEWGDGK